MLESDEFFLWESWLSSIRGSESARFHQKKKEMKFISEFEVMRNPERSQII